VKQQVSPAVIAVIVVVVVALVGFIGFKVLGGSPKGTASADYQQQMEKVNGPGAASMGSGGAGSAGRMPGGMSGGVSGGVSGGR
jgi:hypothetical protein